MNGSNSPKKAPRLSRRCIECGADFRTNQPSAICCSRPCTTARANREKKRGVELLALAMDWRRGRGRGLVEFKDITMLLDRFISEDRAREKAIGYQEPPAADRRQVMHGGKIVGSVEQPEGSREYFWRPAAPGALRDTRRRHRRNPDHAVPLRFKPRGRVTYGPAKEKGE